MPALDFSSTPSPGTAVSKFIVYNNDKKIFEGELGQSGVTLFSGEIRNGFHLLPVFK